MGKLNVFNFVSLNGYFKGPGEDVSWAHERQESDYAGEMAGGGSMLLFGRVTYAMMAGFWPSPAAAASMPRVAEGMNAADKIVFSRTLKKADWNNTTVVSGDIEAAVRERKESGGNMTILGSGSIVRQLADAGLIDEYELMVHPVVLAHGTSIFHGIQRRLNLELAATRAFESGTVLLSYRSAV